MANVASHDPLEAVTNSQHLDAGKSSADRGRADDAVDTWCRPAPDGNC